MSNAQREVYCSELAELIAACDPDDPDPLTLARIEEHIGKCPVCDSAEAALSESVAVYRVNAPAGVRVAFEEALVERLCRNPEKTRE